METPRLLRRSNRLEAKEQSKAIEQPNQSKATGAKRSKRLAKPNNPLPEEQVEEPPIVEPLDSLSALPFELFCIIMNILEVWEQFTVRRVCHSWKDKIQAMFNEPPKECLKLNVKKANTNELESRCMRTWQPNESIARMQFDFAYKEPVIVPTKHAQISIWDRAFNSDAALVLGSIFNQVKTVIIYWDTEDSEENIDNLVALLSHLNVFTTFGLIVSGQVTQLETLPKICTAINTHLAPLKQLHLMVPKAIATTNQQQEVAYSRVYPLVELEKAVSFATNFSITGGVYIGSLLKSVGQKLTEHTQLESLSIPLCSFEVSEAITLAALSSNKAKFASVKRLLLFNIREHAALERLLSYFPNVEKLFLKFYETATFPENFGGHWIRALMPLTKLAELTLVNYIICKNILNWNIDGQPGQTVLNQVRKLTVASPTLFFDLCKTCNAMRSFSPLIPELLPEDIGHTIEMGFPGLQELNMWSGDCEVHQKPQHTWQTFERHINRVLPLSLPQLPQLRVNIRLCHPLMYHEYHSQPARVLEIANAMAASNAHLMDANFALENITIAYRHRLNDAVHRAETAHERDQLVVQELAKRYIQILAQIGVQIGPQDLAQAQTEARAQLEAQKAQFAAQLMKRLNMD